MSKYYNEEDLMCEIDLSSLVEKNDLDTMFYLKDLRERKLFLMSDISRLSVADISKHIMQFNADDKDIDPKDREPIKLYIASEGGSVSAGYQLMDIICNSKTPVYTINISECLSMAFSIFAAGHKRFSLPSSIFLLHDGAGMIQGSSTKMGDIFNFYSETNKRYKDFIVSHTKISEEQYDKNESKEWYMYPQVAKELGVVDYIIGEDCELDDII